MKVFLKFELPEDREEYDIYCNAYKYYDALIDIKNFFRARMKHHEENNGLHTEVYERLIDILNERGIDI